VLSPTLLAPLLMAAALVEPLEGALGFDFAQPVPETATAAALEAYDLPNLPDNIEFEPLPDDLKDPAGWFLLAPLRLPEALAAAQPEVFGLLDADSRPARLIARIDERGCDGLYAWLNSSLTRKYAVADDASVAARAPFMTATRYVRGQRQIDVACGPAVLLQYTDIARLTDWRSQQLARYQQRLKRQAEQQRALAVVAEHQLRQFADRFTIGDQARLQGGLGVVFNQPVDPDTLPEDFAADQPLAVRLNDLPTPFDQGEFQIEVDPVGAPIELSGDIGDPTGAHFEQIFLALKAKYGQPVKDGVRHKIFRVNGNFFVLKALPRTQKLQISLLDGAARRAQRERAKQHEAAELAALQDQFRKETEGL